MNLGFGRVHTTIRLTVVTVFIIATALTALVAIGLQYYFGRVMATDAAADLYTTASDSIAAELRNVAAINANVIDLLSDNPSLSDRGAENAHLETFIRVLEKNPLYYGVYIGHDDGEFFEVINLNASEQARRALMALPSDRWLVMTVSQGADNNIRRFRYLDENLTTRLERSELTDYDVRTRSWYKDAVATADTVVSPPYLFAQLGIPGRTLSRQVNETGTIVAIDMTLSSISRYLRDHTIAQHGSIYLYDRSGDVIASSLDSLNDGTELPITNLSLTMEEQAFIKTLPELRVSNETDWPPIDFTQAGNPSGYAVDVIRMIEKMTGIEMRFLNGPPWVDLVEKFENGELDVLQSVIQTSGNADLGLFGEPFLRIPFAVLTAPGQPTITDISQLEGQTVAIPSGWSIIEVVRDRFPDIEIVEVDNTLEAIRKALSGEVTAAIDNEVIIQFVASHYFLKGFQLHSNVDFGQAAIPDQLHIVVQHTQPMLRGIIDKALAAIGEEQRLHLEDKWFNFEKATQQATSNTVPSEVFVDIASNSKSQGKLMNADINNIPHLVYAAPTVAARDNPLFLGISTPVKVVMAPFIDQVRLSIIITAAFMLLLLPFSWFFANPIVRPIRQLAAENNKVQRREYDEVTEVKSYVRELDELSESMVGMVKSIQAHELAQRELMDSIIKLIAQAIDDKSAYTGGHCERVPELAMMLAEHASNSDLDAFTDFSLKDEEQWREYRIAAWLHDCGKITTPEHIVDKGSKLETIYNRIHEIRMRFEVLWRDAELNYLQAIIESPEKGAELKESHRANQAQLKADFAFVADCNVGGEFLDDEKLERLRSIAEITWQRYFDDRIGLSPVEELRVPPVAVDLPISEKLLADRPEHIIERTRSTDYPPEFGIDMDIPKHLSNQGEIYNLSISRGTLTDEDRFKINEHMISTIKMLEGLPFPPELKNVPRYASTHHETMRGSGYPRRLPGEQLSIPERLLAVADIFEALTASDRPYKKAKPVSVAIDILHKMVLDQHIDRDCFELFIRDKVYEEYAQRFLPPEQLDDVDVSRYL